VDERVVVLSRMSDEELQRLQESKSEELLIDHTKVVCTTWHEMKQNGEQHFVVQVWGQVFMAGGWIIAADGFALSQGRRNRLTGLDLD